jgi:uncharacterized protein (TIGR02145 family)
MKKLFTIIAFVTSLTIFAQAPQGFNYQATVRNSSGTLLLNQQVLVKFNILQNSSTGTVVYTETQTASTDDLGHISLVVGQGTATTVTFSTINWGSGTYYLGIELNTGTGYVAMGTTQLLSVPYALHSNCVSSTLLGDTLTVGCKTYILPGILETNVVDHTCGATNVHNPALAYGSMADQEGNIYRTIKIGTQTWMAENLKTTKYRNGESIPNIMNNTQWANLTTGALNSYNNNIANDCPYGKLYNWYAVNDNRGICPLGWHVPSLTEWNLLITNAGGSNQAMISLKSSGSFYWQSPNNINGSNSTGFSALPSGLGFTNGGHQYINFDSLWWTSTVSGNNSYYVGMRNAVNPQSIFSFPDNKNYAFCVRCIKD